VTPRPRVQKRRSRAERSDQRWAMDVTHVPCGRDGWGHLTAVIDCHDREIVGWEFALRGRAKEAERALEGACIGRFGTLRPAGSTPVIRSDNGLIFQSRRFRSACRDYRLRQEFITPYTPEQNGMIERFFRSLKEECTWQHIFPGFREAMDPLVQRGAPSPGARLQESARVSSSTINRGGLTPREHYKRSLAKHIVDFSYSSDVSGSGAECVRLTSCSLTAAIRRDTGIRLQPPGYCSVGAQQLCPRSHEPPTRRLLQLEATTQQGLFGDPSYALTFRSATPPRMTKIRSLGD
jgi:putative transposase